MKMIITLNNGFVIGSIMNVEEYNLKRETSRIIILKAIEVMVKEGLKNGNEKLEL